MPTPTNNADVHAAFLSLLQTSLGLSESQCFTVDEDDKLQPSRVGDLAVVVIPLDSDFDDPLLSGGGEMTCVERYGVDVVIISAMRLDRTGGMEYLLQDVDRGLYEWKRRVLAAVVGQQLTVDGNEVLTALMYPTRGTRPQSDRPVGTRSLRLTIALDFEWDLTT